MINHQHLVHLLMSNICVHVRAARGFPMQNPGREASLRELLASLQADAELLSKGPSAEVSCSSGASAGSVAAEEAAAAAAAAAGVMVPAELQQQLTRLTQNCAELGEAVLQLDVQVQQVRHTPWTDTAGGGQEYEVPLHAALPMCACVCLSSEVAA